MTEFLALVSVKQPWVTIAVWAVLASIGVVLNITLLDSATTTELRLTGNVESQRAETLLEDRLRGPQPITEIVVVQSESLTVDDPAFRGKVEQVHGDIMSLGAGTVTAGTHYYLANDESLVSADRGTTLITLMLVGDIEEATERVGLILDIVTAADASDEFRVLMSGPATFAFENSELSADDLEQGERIGVPVALIVLLALFGTVVASLIPLGLAVVAIIIASGIAAIIGQFFELVFFVTLMITMIGLAVGIDYSLFVVSRFREEMNRGQDKVAAAVRSTDTAGRTVLFSGLTVVVALCGMLIVPASFFQSLGLGAILVVIVAMAATLTLLPAVLALMGTKVNLLPLPYFGRRRVRSGGEGRGTGFWEMTTRAVTRVPMFSFIVVVAPMILAIVFYFDIDTGINGADSFPEGTQTREAFFVLEEKFSFGLVHPAEIAIDGNVFSPEVEAATARLADAIVDDPAFPIPPVVVPNSAGDLALMSVVIAGEPSGQVAVDAMGRLREKHIPAAFDGVPAQAFVGGLTAASVDLFAIVDRYTPIVFAFVLGFSFIVLLLVFRSVVIPVKAVVMNLLSVGTAYGLLVLVFQKGVATDLLGFEHAEVIDAWIPLFLFTIVFGLSMDYHVFMLSRIRERYDQTGDNTAAVAEGLRSTAGLITGAVLIMVAVFGAFAVGKTIINQQVGFGLAVAILLDATLVRSVLVPASMEMLGRANWYLPPWLVWLPDLRVEQAGESYIGQQGRAE